MPWAALRAVARAEWARSWKGLVALGIVVGLIGGALVSGVALARRTSSAPERLIEAVEPGDVRLSMFAPGLAEDILDLPQVARSVRAGIAVGRIDGPGVRYVGVLVPEERQPGMLRPVVVEGRAADPDAADEVVVTEVTAGAMGVRPGSRLAITLLTPEEVSRFDTGFGDPDGPRLELQVTGIVRVPPGLHDGSPVIATPALAAEIEPLLAGTDLFVALRPTPDADASFRSAVDELGSAVEMPAGAEEFPPVIPADPAEGTVALVESSRVLVAGLLLALGVALLAGLVVVWQALVRHHAGSAHAQAVESALGLATVERATARAVPVVATALVAAVVAAATAVAGAGLEPLGALARVEPEPGWRLDPATVGLGAALVGLLVSALGFVTAWRAGALVRGSVAPVARRVWWAPHRGGWPLVGASLAIAGDGRSRVAARASLAGAVVGLAGVVAAMTFGSTLDRLVASPERYGWNGDVVVVDVTDEILEELRRDPRVESVADVGSSTVRVGRRDVQAYALTPTVGAVGWTITIGRAPAEPGEVVVGTRVAADLGVEVGDALELAGQGTVDVRVVGVGLGPALSGERLGASVLAHPATLDEVAPVQLFREALVDLDDEHAAAVVEEWSRRYEVATPELPVAVRDLADLGPLPELFGAFLAALAVVALSHALTVTARRRAADLAVLRTLGSTPGQVAAAVLAMAITTAAIGVVLGGPLGWAAARLAWAEVARATGVAGDVVVPVSVAVALLAAAVVAVVVALLPARRTARAGGGSLRPR